MLVVVLYMKMTKLSTQAEKMSAQHYYIKRHAKINKLFLLLTKTVISYPDIKNVILVSRFLRESKYNNTE